MHLRIWDLGAGGGKRHSQGTMFPEALMHGPETECPRDVAPEKSPQPHRSLGGGEMVKIITTEPWAAFTVCLPLSRELHVPYGPRRQVSLPPFNR